MRQNTPTPPPLHYCQCYYQHITNLLCLVLVTISIYPICCAWFWLLSAYTQLVVPGFDYQHIPNLLCLVLVTNSIYPTCCAWFWLLSAQLLWLLKDQLYRGCKIHKDSMKGWIFTVIVTLKITINFLHKTLQLRMMYHPIWLQKGQQFSR